MNTTFPIVHDCFTYNGEDDLLWLRLETLKTVVHRVVIAEATRTFTGAPKQLRFDVKKFPDHASRIEYIVVDDLKSNPISAWENEFHQRNALARSLVGGVDGLFPDDHWIVLSDVDEIPRPEVIQRFQPNRYISALLAQKHYCYTFNNMVVSEGASFPWWRRVRITTVGQLRDWFGSLQSLRDYRATGPFRSVSRLWNRARTQNIDNAGWHFAYLMTPEQIIEKLNAFSHQEFNVPEIANLSHIRRCLDERRDIFGNGKFNVVPLDESFPKPLIANRERFAHLIL